jgi:hypothetical protein
VAPNTNDDSHLLIETLSNLMERTNLKTIYSNGGHVSPDTDTSLQAQKVKQVQIAIRGCKPNPDILNLADFEFQFEPEGKPLAVTCPQGQAVGLNLSRMTKAFMAYNATEACERCPLVEKSPSLRGKRDPRRRLCFTQAEAQAATRRRLSLEE